MLQHYSHQRLCTWVIRAIMLTLAWLPISALGAASDMPGSMSYTMHWINRTRVHVISVNLQDQSLLVTPCIAYDTPGRRRSFISFLAERQPLAQITGSYFSLKSSLPIGDIVIRGKLRYDGSVGSALAITPYNEATIVNVPKGKSQDWTGYETVLQGGVRLVQNGHYAVYPKQYGFHDRSLFRHATRTAVGITKKGRLLLVAVNKDILVSELARLMMELGCTDAMTMDGGTSTGLAYGTDVLLKPGRTLSNVLMVVKRPVDTVEPVNVKPGTPTPAAPTPAPSGSVIGPPPPKSEIHNAQSDTTPQSKEPDKPNSPLTDALSTVANLREIRYSTSEAYSSRNAS